MNGVRHIGLGTLAGDKILGGTGLAGHLMDQGDTLSLSSEDIIIAVGRHQLQKLPGAGHSQLRVAKADKCADIQVIRYLADGQFSLQACHFDGICHRDCLLIFLSETIPRLIVFNLIYYIE